MIRMIGPKLVRLMFAAVLLACALQTPLLSDNPVGGQAEGDKQDVPAVSVLPSASLSPVTAAPQEQSTAKSNDLLSVTPAAPVAAPAPAPVATPASVNQTPSIDEIKKQLSDLQTRFATINDQLKSNQTAAADAMGRLGELNKLLTQHQQQVAKAIEANKSSAADIVKIKSLEQENRELKAKLVDANAAIDSLAKLNRRYADQIAAMEAGKKSSSPATTTAEPAPSLPTPKADTKSDSDVKTTPAIQEKPRAAALVPEKTADVAPEMPLAPIADKAPQATAAKEITPTLSDEPMTVELAPAKSAAVKETPKPAAPTKAKIEGTIMVVMGNTAAIDIGSNSGLTPGTILDVVQDGKNVARMKIVSVGDGDAGGTIENPTTQVNPGATVVLR